VNRLTKKRKFLFKIATVLIAYATIIPMNGSFFLVGEPEIPRSMQKEDNMV
jgi:hypothetical protein